MNFNNKLLLIKNEPSDSVTQYIVDLTSQKCAVTFTNGKTFNYHIKNVEILSDPEELNAESIRFASKDGIDFYDVGKILKFKNATDEYYRLFFNSGLCRSYNSNYLTIENNALATEEVKELIEYYKNVAEIVGLKSEVGKNVLKSQYEGMSFISETSVLAKYLNATQIAEEKIAEEKTVIFPFGCNLSQIDAVSKALANQISVIEGPPGTGKTQTILNIIANIVMQNKTVAVVSNNNSATDNIFEKLQKYRFDYFAAQLGKTDNKKDFISIKQLQYPNFEHDTLEHKEISTISKSTSKLKLELQALFESQNKIAQLKCELSSLETEKMYFDEYFALTCNDIVLFRANASIGSDEMLALWNYCQDKLDNNKQIGFWFSLHSILFYDIKGFSLYREDLANIISQIKKRFYLRKIKEITLEINKLSATLAGAKFNDKSSELADKSLMLFKVALAKKYKKTDVRPIFKEDALWQTPNEFLKEYPVILSTTHSARSSLKDVIYDYVIVDEASQVDLATGVLAMSCANNMVIVGDLMQLPNVIAESDKLKIAAISKRFKVDIKYRFEDNSLLSAICKVFNNIPRTLLREHYRCHPKIIGFCNQKFYNNQLVVMTQDNGEADVMKVNVTTTGNHARDNLNQRQIDEIQLNILPELSSCDVGIIAPYRKQTAAIDKTLNGDIEVSTVHKFQGREKADIIISTVDNEIGDFVDNANMLNVAVSRAKNRLRVIVSDNEKNENTNIGDLVKYIQYNNFEIKKSDVFSVFDMLYKCYNVARKQYLYNRQKISEFDSENLMYSVIEDVLSTDMFLKLDVIPHQQLNSIIRDPYKLNKEEAAYAMNNLTHIDFLIYNKIDKSPVLAVEVDGYAFHKAGTRQNERDNLKDVILQKYSLPIIRFSTTGSMEKDKLQAKLKSILA